MNKTLIYSYWKLRTHSDRHTLLWNIVLKKVCREKSTSFRPVRADLIFATARINKSECSSLIFTESSLFKFSNRNVQNICWNELRNFCFSSCPNSIYFTTFNFFQLSWYKIQRTHRAFMVSKVPSSYPVNSWSQDNLWNYNKQISNYNSKKNYNKQNINNKL